MGWLSLTVDHKGVDFCLSQAYVLAAGPCCFVGGKPSGFECIYSENLELEVKIYRLVDQPTEQENSCISELQMSSTRKIRYNLNAV